MLDYNNHKITFNDIFFEDRNKLYAAYLLRKLYDEQIITAVWFASISFALAIMMPVLYDMFKPKTDSDEVEKAITTTLTVPPPIDSKTSPPPPMPKASVPPAVKQIEFLPPS